MTDWWNDAAASDADARVAADPGAPAADVIGVDVTDATDPGELEAEQLIADLDTLQRERDDLLDTTKRLQADFENYRKRVLREQTVLVERASENIVEQLLPVLDSFELAIANLDSDTDDRVRKGIELVYAELFAVLERAGLEPIAARGAPFDPNEHEAVMQDDGEGEPHVGDVLRAGWKLKGRVLRPAMVKVVRETQA
jgi:molecular chaperone GrpE